MGDFLAYELLPVILNMTLTASVVIVLVLLVRLALRRAPRICSYALWLVVLFRLLCPVTLTADISLMGLLDAPVTEVTAHTSAAAYVPRDMVHDPAPAVEMPVPGIGEAVTDALPQGEEQTVADPLEAPMAIATLAWMAGTVAMAVWGLVSLVRLRRRLVGAVPLERGVYLADHIDTPFVLGLIRPKIYLPSTLPEGERGYILLHERHHIRRLDHVVKPLSFLALCIHWFNPLVWLMFVLLGRDMEMSCDEAVMRKLGEAVRADYSASLLRLATGRKIIAGAPLAFGEGDTRDRVKNVLQWKRPRLWGVLAGAAVCAAVIAACAVNPKASGPDTKSHLRLSPALEAWLADNIDGPVYLPAEWDPVYSVDGVDIFSLCEGDFYQLDFYRSFRDEPCETQVYPMEDAQVVQADFLGSLSRKKSGTSDQQTEADGSLEEIRLDENVTVFSRDQGTVCDWTIAGWEFHYVGPSLLTNEVQRSEVLALSAAWNSVDIPGAADGRVEIVSGNRTTVYYAWSKDGYDWEFVLPEVDAAAAADLLNSFMEWEADDSLSPDYDPQNAESFPENQGNLRAEDLPGNGADGTESVTVSLTAGTPIPPTKAEWNSNSDAQEVTMADIAETLAAQTLPDGTKVLFYISTTGKKYCAYIPAGTERLIRFTYEENGYTSGYGISLYENVLGTSGFRIECPRGAAYYANDYYYFDEDGILWLLVGCGSEAMEVDLNGDGQKELLWSYHGYELYYDTMIDGQLYEADLCSLTAEALGYRERSGRLIALEVPESAENFADGETGYILTLLEEDGNLGERLTGSIRLSADTLEVLSLKN